MPDLVWRGAEYLRPGLVAIDALEPWPDNPRRGDVAAIAASLDRFGQVRPVLVQGTRIVAGHHLVLAALEQGWTHVAVGDHDFGDEDEARAYLLADNRTAELGSVDDELLAAQLAALRDMRGIGYSDDDRAAIDVRLAALRGERPTSETIPLAPSTPKSEVGKVYELGPHRLYCGDALDALTLLYADVQVGAVLTDPPYGIALDTDYRKMPTGSAKARQGLPRREHRPVAGDDQPFDAAPFVEAFAAAREQFWFGGDYYRRTLSPDDLDGSWLVWDKRNESSDAGIGSGFELIWSRQRHKRLLLRHYFFGVFGAEGANRMHPTQKPTPMLCDIIQRWVPEACIVADPFAGSGSTLIACDKTGRICYAAELEPAYCDVIRKRYADHVGDPSLRP